MRFLPILTLLSTVAACSGDDEVVPRTDDDFEPPQVIDTGWPPGDLGTIQLVHSVNSEKTQIYAVFAESAPSFVNLAECAIDGTICISGFPSDEDDWEDLDPDQEADRDAIPTTFVGYEMTLGDFELPYRVDPETKFGFYYYDASADELPQGWLGASFGGQLELYEGEEDMFVPPPMELQKPAIDDHIVFTNNEFVPLEWVPTNEGFVTLAVFTRFTLARHFLVEDDGYFELDVDGLGLSGNTEDLTFVFTRWSRTSLNHKGHAIRFVASSEAYFTGEYVLVGNRTFTTTPDECTEAEGRQALQAGGWWGFLGGPVNADYDPTNGCILGADADARGKDGIFRIDVQPKHSIGIDYNTYEESASVYLLDDCNNIGTCFAGNDVSPDPNVSEFVQYFNPDDEIRSIYVVFDSTESGDTVYTVDMTDEELLPPDMYDTCAEAEAAPNTLYPGSYYAEFTAYTDGLNPGAGGCTGTSLPGPDSMTPITLQSGETLTLNVSMPGGDPGVYLLYNCLNAFSCPVGSDASIGQNEELYYQNQSAGTENLFIVVDSKTVMRPYFMGVQIY
jgi:hypothetical protein